MIRLSCLKCSCSHITLFWILILHIQIVCDIKWKRNTCFPRLIIFFVFSFQRSGQNQGRCVCLGKDQAFYTSGVRTWQTHPVKNKNARILERIEKLSRPVVSGSFSKVRVLVTAQFKVYASRAFAHILHPSSRVWNYWNNSLVNFNFLVTFSANRMQMRRYADLHLATGRPKFYSNSLA